MIKTLLLGTTNPIKIEIVRAAVENWSVQLLTPADLGLALAVPETGHTTLQNAEIKARAYCAQTNLLTLAIDGGLWIEKFPAEKQPGARVKRLVGEGATDQQVLEFYLRELSAMGGESPCIWEGSLALAFPDQRVITETYQTRSLLTAKARGKPAPGIVLAPITIHPATGKYYSEMRWEEYPDVGKIRLFLGMWLW